MGNPRSAHMMESGGVPGGAGARRAAARGRTGRAGVPPASGGGAGGESGPAEEAPQAPDDPPRPDRAGGEAPGAEPGGQRESDGRESAGGEKAGKAAIWDLRGIAAHGALLFPAGARLVISGLPGSGKSTLIQRAVATAEAPVCGGGRAAHGVEHAANTPRWSGDTHRPDRPRQRRPRAGTAGVVPVQRVDSQDTRERWERGLPGWLRWLPYGAYRPLVRLAHYLRLHLALASEASVVVHDCGSQSWVRRWLAWDARRRGRSLHMLLLDVPPEVALHGQSERGRGVSDQAFLRHRRAVSRLLDAAEAGELPAGCVSLVLVDRTLAGALNDIRFEPALPVRAAPAFVPGRLPRRPRPAAHPAGAG